MLMCLSPWMTGVGGTVVGLLSGACLMLVQQYRDLDPIRELTERLRHPYRWAMAHPVRAAHSYILKRRVVR